MLQWLISIWMVFCVCQPSALAQTAVDNSASSTDSTSTTASTYSYPREEIFKLWLVRRDMRSLGDDPLGFSALDSIQKKRLSLGLENIPEISLALLRESQQNLDKGKRQEAIKLTEYAALLSPGMLEPQLQLLKMHLTGKLLSSSKYNVVKTVATTVKLIRKSPEAKFRLFFNVVIAAWTIVLTTLAIFVGISLLRVIPLHLHKLQHLFASQPPAYLFCFFYLAAMIAIGVSIGWIGAGALLLLIIWPYISKFDKGLLLALLALALIVAAAKAQAVSYLRYTDGPLAPAVTIQSGLDIGDKVAKLNELLQSEKSPEILYSLAVAEKIAGRLDVAKTHLEKLLMEDANFTAAQILLANVLYKMKEARQAIDLYRKVSADNPDNLLARFNLGKVYYNEAVLEPGNEALKQAKMIDSNEFDRLENLFKQDNAGTHLFDPVLDWPTIIKKTATLPNAQLLNQQVIGFGAIIALLMAYVLFRVFRGSRPLAHRCDRCGVISCIKCDATASMSDLCSQCHNIYIKKVTIDPELKIKKEQAIRGYQNRRVVFQTVSTLFYPGVGAAYRQSTMGAWLQIAFSTLFLTLLLPLPYLQSTNALATVSGLLMGLMIVGFAVFYVISFINIIRR